MDWALLLDWRLWIGAAFVALGLFAAVQTSRLDHEKTAFAQFRADTERLGAEAKVAAARQEALQAQHAKEAIDALQTRVDRLNGAYDRLRAGSGGGGVPDLASAAAKLGSCPVQPSEPDPVARFLAEVESRITRVLEGGDKEIAKYVELYQLDQHNNAAR